MNTLPYELQHYILDLAVKKNKYLQLKEFVSQGTGVDTLWFSLGFFQATIMQELIVEFPNIRPHEYFQNHLISYFERPLYYQKVICAAWKLYFDLDPERQSVHVQEVVMRIITNVCIDYFHSILDSDSSNSEMNNSAVYEWITKVPEVSTILDTLVRRIDIDNPMETIENYYY